MAVYFFYGEEDYNIEKEISKLKASLDKNFLEMNFKAYKNPSFADLISILYTQPMMFGKMLIVIECYEYFSKTFEDAEINELETAINSNNDNVDIIFTAKLPRGENKKLDSRKKLFKLLSKNNAKEFLVIPTYKTTELEAAITKMAKAKDLKLDKNALTQIAIQLGNNLRQIDIELDKLRLYIYPKNIVYADDVKEMCISNEDLFAFSDFLMMNEKDKALLEYRKLLDIKYPLEILSVLQTLVRQWIVIKSKAKTLGTFELSKLLKIHEYRVKVQLQKMKNTSLKTLVKLKENLTDAEYRIKSGQALNLEEEIENAIFR